MANKVAPLAVQPAPAVQTPQVVQLVVGKPEKADDGMGGLEFASSVISAPAWPVAAVIIAAIFHKHIAALLSKIRKLNWGDASVELADKLDKVEDTARVIEAEFAVPVPAFPQNEVPSERFERLLEISPSAAILDAWKPVEQRLTLLGKEYYGNNTKYSLPDKIAERLASDGHLKSSVVAMVADLRKIRNEAAHAREVNVTDALRFNQLALQTMHLLVTP